VKQVALTCFTLRYTAFTCCSAAKIFWERSYIRLRGRQKEKKDNEGIEIPRSSAAFVEDADNEGTSSYFDCLCDLDHSFNRGVVYTVCGRDRQSVRSGPAWKFGLDLESEIPESVPEVSPAPARLIFIEIHAEQALVDSFAEKKESFVSDECFILR
jgi:hypothetical protein